MTHIRVNKSVGPFISGNRGICMRETEDSVWMKGVNLKDLNLPEEVVFGPIPKSNIEEYVPGPPERTLTEIVGEFWERRGQ